MKKSLLAVAVLGAFAGSALAADVTLYGVIDTGLTYTHANLKNGTNKVNKFEMTTGNQSGSRWGLKGNEELGNGWKVGFVLESTINSDTGKSDSKRLFNREAAINVAGPYGTVYAGHLGAPLNGTGSIGKAGMLTAFGTSWKDYAANAGSTFIVNTTNDNAIAYVSPKFAGFQGYVYYAMGDNDAENKRWSDRYAAIAVTYNNGPIALLANVDRYMYERDQHAGYDVDDGTTITIGGSYDFGVAKVYAAAQYFDEVNLASFGGMKALYSYDATEMYFPVKGWGLNVSASAPAFGGTAMVGVSYADGKSADSVKDADGPELDVNRARITVGYTYPFSKRTNVYVVAGYGKDELKWKAADTKQKPDYATAMFGIRHTF
jgi:predicted porin